nr:SDR family NAD(P)-dependent oxidoreductase [Rhodospirillales bacterium]
MATGLFDLSGRVAVVTGGNGGIGLGMAEGLAGAGAAVMVVGRNAAKNAAAEARLRALGGAAASVAADVEAPQACQSAVEADEARSGR